MTSIRGLEAIANPLQKSALNKKSLCDYVVNVASGCLHGCTFCYVPATPAIRTRSHQLQERGVADPQMNWGDYLFIREQIPEKLDQLLSRKKTWETTKAGRGVVLLCSGTDPYQNAQTAAITRRTVKVLLKYNKRVRILTRGLLWINDLDILVHPNVTVGMSLPYLEDELSRRIEPYSPPPSARLKCLQKAYQHGCRLYVAVAPTIPSMSLKDFAEHLNRLMDIEPETIFWEPMNARGTNGLRMAAAGLNFAKSVMDKNAWAKNFIWQWRNIEEAASAVGCLERLHIWPDQALVDFVDPTILNHWWYRPTPEQWGNEEKSGNANSGAVLQE